MNQRSPFLALLLGILITACSASPEAARPPEIAYGQDVCDACGMIISEARFAAAVALESGEALSFDDAGEMFGYVSQHPDLEIRAWFVHDYTTESWLNAAEASFVSHPSVRTPMASGVVAFADRAEAEAFAAEHGVVILTFQELVTSASMPMK